MCLISFSLRMSHVTVVTVVVAAMTLVAVVAAVVFACFAQQLSAAKAVSFIVCLLPSSSQAVLWPLPPHWALCSWAVLQTLKAASFLLLCFFLYKLHRTCCRL